MGQNIKLKVQIRMTTINQLDPSQEYILKSLLNFKTKSDNNISVIYGPPGTGKSYFIVSLLFELAIRKKKILFVSQNREALDVIDRMISRIENELIEQDGENYISLRDFCLMIYKKRGTLKYITEQCKHALSKVFPNFDPDSTEADNDIPYNLSYVNLDKKLNYNISQDQEIGLDELLMHHLKYVKNNSPLPVPVKSLDKIDIRKIFNEFNNFSDEYNQFSNNNNPSNSLCFISKTNCEIDLNEIHSKILEINDIFSKIDFSKILHNVLQSISIIDLLDIYKNLPDITNILNIPALQQDKVDVDELFKECQEAINLNEKLINVDDIQGIYCVDNEILCDINSEYLSDREEIENCRNDIARAKKRAEEITAFSQELASFNLKDAMSSISLTANKHFKTFDKYPYLKDIDTEKLKELIDTTRCEFKESIQILHRLFNQIILEDKIENNLNNLFHFLFLTDRRTIFYKYQRVITLISLEIELTEKEKKLKTIKSAFKILLGTHYTLNDCYKFSKEAIKAAYNPINNIDENEANNILNKILTVYEIAVKYKLEYKYSIKDILSISNRILEDFEIYNKILKKNLNLAGHNKELISHINANIKNRKINEKLFPIVKKYAKYLYSSEEKDDFTTRAKNIKFREEAKSILSKVFLADLENPVNIELKKIDELSNLLKNLYDRDIFSERFYKIDTKENILDWHERIKNILYLQNGSKFNCFTNQNKFINRLKKLLGNNAQLIIDDFLKNDRVTYEDFAKKVINDLIRAKLNTFPYKNISDNYLKEYKKNLRNTRKNYLLKGLEILYSYTEQARKYLKNLKYLDWRKNTNLVNSAFPIIIATPKEVAKYISDEKELLDYIIFDEASQLLPGQALTSIYRGKKTIIIGDPNQMPPSKMLFDNNNIGEINDDGTEESILDLAIAQQTDATYHLKVHYRSESNILFEPSRKAIYKDDGIEKIFEAGSEDKITPISIEDNLGTDDEKNFHNIVKYIEEKPEDSSFVLLFTRGDIKENFGEYAFSNLSNRLRRRIINNDRFLISTVTNCQGIEGDYSIIYLNHYDSIRFMWFFKSNTGAYKRLNVAITRAKKSLKIFMADSKGDWLKACKEIKSNSNYSSPNQLKSAELMESLIENGTKQINEAYMDSLLKGNVDEIDSPLTQQLYNKLIDYYRSREKELKIYCEVGWHLLIPDYSGIRQNKKNIGFRLDIGIYSLKKKRFILGIEMDGATYHKGFNKAFSDAQRQEILEIKGWNIYRIWSTNWLNDANEEFKKLTSKIDTLI